MLFSLHIQGVVWSVYNLKARYEHVAMAPKGVMRYYCGTKPSALGDKPTALPTSCHGCGFVTFELPRLDLAKMKLMYRDSKVERRYEHIGVGWAFPKGGRKSFSCVDNKTPLVSGS